MKWRLIVRVGWHDVVYDNFDSLEDLDAFVETLLEGKVENDETIKVTVKLKGDEDE